MAISPELEAQILRYFHVEKWLPGTIARQLGVHHSTVDRVLCQAGLPKASRPHRPSLIDPYLPFVLETLEQFPTLTASRLYAMVCERGYTGGPDHFRHLVALHRPPSPAEAYLRLRTLPGEQGQVDWAHFGTITIGKAVRALMAFVILLSFSRWIFLRFFLDARMSNFLRGHEAAFRAWGGLPRVLLYDNLKSAVLERRGEAIRFHPTLLDFSAHYRFEPRPVAVARGNEKGRVERAIRYVRVPFHSPAPPPPAWARSGNGRRTPTTSDETGWPRPGVRAPRFSSCHTAGPGAAHPRPETPPRGHAESCSCVHREKSAGRSSVRSSAG